MTALVVGPVIALVVVAWFLLAGGGAPDPRFIPCSRCDHLRIEHNSTGKRCDVREPHDDPSPCKCEGYRARAGAAL